MIGIFALTPLLTRCSSSDDAVFPEDKDPKVEAPPGQLALRVEQARQTKTMGAANELQIAVTLANGVGGKAVPLIPALFAVTTTDGLRHEALSFASSSSWVDGEVPDSTTELTGGYSYRLRLAFDIDEKTPKDLSISVPGAGDIGDGRTATAPIVLEPCTSCGDRCTYLDRDASNCGTCGVELWSQNTSNITCVGGKTVCAESNETACPLSP